MAARPQPNSKPLVAAAVLFSWTPLIGVGVLVGLALGWAVTAAVALAGVCFLALIRADTGRRQRGERRSNARTGFDMALMTLFGSTVGGLLLGGPAALGGAMFGFCMVLGHVPISVKDENGELREFDSQNPAQAARLYGQVKLLVVGSVALCALGVTVATIFLVARST